MGTPQQLVDSYLGPKTYDEWQKMDQQERNAEHEYWQNRIRLQLSLSSPLVQRINPDFDVVYKIAGDYSSALKLVSVGRQPNKAKIIQVHDLYTLALIVVDNENDMLQAMFATGFAAAWVVFPFAILQAQANAMVDGLEELKKELKKAEHEVSNARNKRAFHLAVNFVEAIFPEISLLGRLGIFVGDVIVDKALGPPEPTKTQRVVGVATPAVKQISEAVHQVPEIGHAAHEVAEKMGKVATVATFYFDYEEISEGEDRVEKLKDLTERVKRSYDALVKVLADYKVKIQQFLMAFERWTKAIEDIRLSTDNYRKRLSEEMAQFNYSVNKTTNWPDAA
jgi:uncharacterized membrane protein YciS (DUF1049 family)